MGAELETRKCVISGKVLPKDELLRFAVLPDGRLLPDFNKKLGGRGVYVFNSRKILESLTVKNSLNKILHKKVVVEENLPQLVEQLLSRKGLEALNLARKSGDLIFGLEKVRECLAENKAAFVIEAADAGADGKQKIARTAQSPEKFTLYSTADLAAMFGRDNTVYLAVKKGRTERFVYSALKKYQFFLNM